MDVRPGGPELRFKAAPLNDPWFQSNEQIGAAGSKCMYYRAGLMTVCTPSCVWLVRSRAPLKEGPRGSYRSLTT